MQDFSGSRFFLMSIEAWITLFILAIVVIAIFYIVSIWIYKRAPANMAFIRTGFMGTKVCLGRGALVLPVFHEVTWVSLETIKLIISRSREQAILTQDKIRVDVVAELYAHVGHSRDQILQASRSLGEKTFAPDQVRNLLEAKVVSALRSYAATKTLNELHENREILAQSIKENVLESFRANGLALEEVSIVALEQTGKEFFRLDNVFDAEGIKIITEITSNARREVHNTEKRTDVAIRQRDLDTQLEILNIEKQESFARASQDMEISNEEALKLREKQVYVLDQHLGVESKEIENAKSLEKLRTERDVYFTDEAQRRETAEVKKALALELEEKSRQIALIEKAKEEELVKIAQHLALEKSEKDREIELIAKEQEQQKAEIERVTAVAASDERGRLDRHKVAEDIALGIRRKSLETRLAALEVDQEESLAAAHQEREVANERAQALSEQQRYLLDQRWLVEQEEINKALALEKARVAKEIAVNLELKKREAVEIQRALAREEEERDRDIALVAKMAELERAEIQRALAREQEERSREIALVAKEEELEKARVRRNLAVELEERAREIALIAKEQERERSDIHRFLARELEERAREIAMAEKTKELEQVEIKRLHVTAQREQAERDVEAVRVIADTKRRGEVERLQAQTQADTRHIDEENKANITRLHMLTQAGSRLEAAKQEADATLIRAKATSEAQQINAVGIEKEAGARGRAEMEVETLRVMNQQRLLEAEAHGIEAKADALKKFNDGATFLELSRLHIEADRDVHIDQAKAMGSALQGAQIRMYGGENGTVNTLRSLFTAGFGLGETLEGIAQSLPEGLRERFAKNGLRGIFGQPYAGTDWRRGLAQLGEFVQKNLGSRKSREISFEEGLSLLEEKAGKDESLAEAVSQLRQVNQHGMFNEVPFQKVWALVKAAAEKEKASSDGGEE